MKMARDMLHAVMDKKVRPLCLKADQDAGYPDSFYKELMPLAQGSPSAVAVAAPRRKARRPIPWRAA